MDTKTFYVLLLSCFIVSASCEYGLSDSSSKGSDDEEKKSNSSGKGGSGGTQQTVEDDAGAGDTGQDGTGDESSCPEGYRCTAPAGVFVCTDPDTYLPPTCADNSDCTFGTCEEYGGEKYCVQECGPTVVSECPEASVCNTFFDGANVCAQSTLWSAPPCQTQDDCPFGECLLSYFGQHFCIQPCESTVVEDCPAETACIPQEGKFYCANPLSGIPAVCNSNDDCEYGVCVPHLDSAFCTLECIPKVVVTCPDQSVCRPFLPLGMFCSDEQTLLPPECEKTEDCSYGTCIYYAGTGYCAQYCSEPGTEILGSVSGSEGALEGVEVCAFDGEKPMEDTCTKTNESGQFAILHLDADIPYWVLSMTKEGYQSSLQLAYVNQLALTTMFTEEEMAQTADELGLDYPVDDTGQIVFKASGPISVAGYTTELQPEVGDGPYYANTANLPDPSLEKASTREWGGYLNVPEGTYFLDFTGADNVVCGDIPAVTVVSGYLSYVVSYCDEWEN